MLSPHHNAKPITFSLSFPLLGCLTVGFLVFASTGFIGLTQTLRFALETTRQSLAQTKVKAMAQELQEMRRASSGLIQLEKDLRFLLSRGDPKDFRPKKNGAGFQNDTLGELLIGKLPDETTIEGLRAEKQKYIENSKSLMALAQTYLTREQNNLHKEIALPSEWPAMGSLTSSYGIRGNPFNNAHWGEHHYGIDLANISGTPIRAAADGVARKAGWFGNYGRAVILDHGFGYSTLYGHASAIAVTQGDFVQRGDIIAYMGSTGRSSGSHLHFEVWQHGRPVNPLQFVALNDLMKTDVTLAQKSHLEGVGGGSN